MTPLEKQSHLASIAGNQAGSNAFEQSKAVLMQSNAEQLITGLDQLEHTITESSKESGRLGTRVFWLNIIITIATAIGAIATVVQAYVAFFKH